MRDLILILIILASIACAVDCSAQFIIDPHRFASGAAPSITATAQGSSGSGGAATSHTLSGGALAIGAADASRVVVTAVGVRSSVDVSGSMTATIEGVPATVVGQLCSGPTPNFQVFIIAAAVPTGTTAEIVLSFPSMTWDWWGWQVWSTTGMDMPPTDTDSRNGGTVLSRTLDAVDGGYIFAAAVGNAATGGAEVSWNAATTEDYEVDPGSVGDTFASSSGSTTGATVTPEATFAASSSSFTAVAYLTLEPQ